MKTNKLNPLAIALTAMILAGISAFIIGLLLQISYTGKPFMTTFGEMYLIYRPSFLNTCIGTVLSIFNAFVGGYIFAWLYNYILDFIEPPSR